MDNKARIDSNEQKIEQRMADLEEQSDAIADIRKQWADHGARHDAIADRFASLDDRLNRRDDAMEKRWEEHEKEHLAIAQLLAEP